MIALLIQVLGSAAASKKSSLDLGGMFRSLVTKNLVMVMTLSRLPMDEMSIEVRDQPRDRRTSLVVGEYKNILNARKMSKALEGREAI